MNQDELNDLAIGVPLSTALREHLTYLTEDPDQFSILYFNKQSSGYVSQHNSESEMSSELFSSPSLMRVTDLTLQDTRTCRLILDDDLALASVMDYIETEYDPSLSLSFSLICMEALLSMLYSAQSRIQSLEQPVTIEVTPMPLKGPLTKVLNYMGILFAQGSYEFLNVAFNMTTKEYELLTGAEIERLRTLAQWGDRRLVITCTKFELANLALFTLPNMEQPNVEQNIPNPRKNRKLSPLIDTNCLPTGNEITARRPRNDGRHTGLQSDLLEPPNEGPDTTDNL